MGITKRLALQRFWERHPTAERPLVDWYLITKHATWRNFAQVRATFGQTDVIRVASGNTVCVFDIAGNHFRLIAKISYEKEKVYVLRVLTHREYDRNAWKDQL